MPSIDAVRARWAGEAERFDAGPDFGFRSAEGESPESYALDGTERWDLSFGTDSRGEPTTITAHLRPCESYSDPDFTEAVGWEPRAEFWVEVWKLQEDLPGRFERAAALVQEVVCAASGIVVLDHREAPPGWARETEVASYVTADVFGRLLREPGFAQRMV